MIQSKSFEVKKNNAQNNNKVYDIGTAGDQKLHVLELCAYKSLMYGTR